MRSRDPLIRVLHPSRHDDRRIRGAVMDVVVAAMRAGQAAPVHLVEASVIAQMPWVNPQSVRTAIPLMVPNLLIYVHDDDDEAPLAVVIAPEKVIDHAEYADADGLEAAQAAAEAEEAERAAKAADDRRKRRRRKK